MDEVIWGAFYANRRGEKRYVVGMALHLPFPLVVQDPSSPRCIYFHVADGRAANDIGFDLVKRWTDPQPSELEEENARLRNRLTELEKLAKDLMNKLTTDK